MSQQASAKNKKAILTASALLSFLAFAMTFATNSRPAYALIVCALSLAGFGVLALMRSEHASAALRDRTLRLYLSYVSLALIVTLIFSDQTASDAIRCAIILTGYAAIYTLAKSLCNICRDHVLIGVAALISILAVYGLAANHFNWLYYTEKTLSQHAVTATFINPNHLATLLGLGVVVSLTLLLRKSHLKVPAAIFLIVCSYTLMQTGSRAGLTAALIAAILMLVCQGYSSKNGDKLPKSLRQLLLVGIATIIFLWLSSQSLTLERFHNLADNASIRLALYSDILIAISNAPLTGYGLGSFEEKYRMFQSETVNMNLTWMNAHSAPLEVVFETGIVTAVVLATAIVSLIVSISKNIQKFSSAQGLAAAGTLTLGVLHSLFDNSLAIPAVATTCATLLGLTNSVEPKN